MSLLPSKGPPRDNVFHAPPIGLLPTAMVGPPHFAGPTMVPPGPTMALPMGTCRFPEGGGEGPPATPCGGKGPTAAPGGSPQGCPALPAAAEGAPGGIAPEPTGVLPGGKAPEPTPTTASAGAEALMTSPRVDPRMDGLLINGALPDAPGAVATNWLLPGAAPMAAGGRPRDGEGLAGRKVSLLAHTPGRITAEVKRGACGTCSIGEPTANAVVAKPWIGRSPTVARCGRGPQFGLCAIGGAPTRPLFGGGKRPRLWGDGDR